MLFCLGGPLSSSFYSFCHALSHGILCNRAYVAGIAESSVKVKVLQTCTGVLTVFDDGHICSPDYRGPRRGCYDNIAVWTTNTSALLQKWHATSTRLLPMQAGLAGASPLFLLPRSAPVRLRLSIYTHLLAPIFPHSELKNAHSPTVGAIAQKTVCCMNCACKWQCCCISLPHLSPEYYVSVSAMSPIERNFLCFLGHGTALRYLQFGRRIVAAHYYTAMPLGKSQCRKVFNMVHTANVFLKREDPALKTVFIYK